MWWNKTVDETVEELNTDPGKGLDSAEVAKRRAQYGSNELQGQVGRSPFKILLEQFTSLMVILLIVAAAVSGLLLHEHEDAAVIMVVVILNALLGFRQEFKAEKAMAALKKMSVPSVRVIRDGKTVQIDTTELVPGDIVQLETGGLVPADCRLVEAASLRIQESALTGEAVAVDKQTDVVSSSEAPVGDRCNMAYMGTVVTYGRGTGVVTAIGMETELGRIATLIQEAEDEKTVLQQKLAQLSRMLVVAALSLIAVVGLQAWLIQKMPLKDIFMTAVSMAVAAIPEGLPAVVTIALALGAQRMLKRHALIRKLPAVETLGSVTVICSDKTGTLTENRMTVTEIILPGKTIDLADTPHQREAELKQLSEEKEAVGFLLAAGALCNDAEIEFADGSFKTIGDPTEGALVEIAERAGLTKAMLSETMPRVNEKPFDSDRKCMTTVHQVPSGAGLPPVLDRLSAAGSGSGSVAFTKGALDSVLAATTHIWKEGGASPLSDADRAEIEEQNGRLAGDGVRVLAIAMRFMDSAESEPEEQLVYIGLAGMLDPLRSEVVDAVQTCHAAGIRPVMITGDHPLIALNIGSELGIAEGGRSHKGSELAQMSREELEAAVRDVSVYARVAPEHKLRIVDAFQKNGHVVAMTGDGVNDAPALKEADIGVAMGITGTDVSKEAADMVLQDDNFSTIVAAVEEGRVILDNIIRFVRFILTSNWAEILVMLLAPLFGMPLPLFPVQILWMNLVTDGLPALALGVEPAESDVMQRPPRDPDAPIISKETGLHILLLGTLAAVLSLLLGRSFYSEYFSAWQTMMFTALVFSQLLMALAERSNRDSLFKIGLFSNPHMLGAVAITFGLQLAVVYVPVLQRFFHTVPLTGFQLLLCLAVGVAMFAAVEVKKLIHRRLPQ